ncbi:hypothetical protein [Amycolatopsis magusensis]|uniref:hypothetical protein n=1 Tax=Amycolatopsis magusensis TaxID=882444 RepID=UPI0024A994BA|nr:hypothetical protein [Amycolatopsis magusensis]MDI5977147.1 hypothetical protein [Amycolatopsis magusensis]
MRLLSYFTRGRIIALIAAALLTVLLGLLPAVAGRATCSVDNVEVACPADPVGPRGEAVSDQFAFGHRPLGTEGSITARLASMTGTITYPPPGHDRIVDGLVPWAKAGLIIKDGLAPGSSYAAIMFTGAHGVRMQHDYVHDTAGSASGTHWVRLTRSGEVVTGYESPDGITWTPVGTARLDGLPSVVQVGLFATSPGDLSVVGGSTQVRFTQAGAEFDHVTVTGSPETAWTSTTVGEMGTTDWERDHLAPGLVEAGDTLRITGSGDIGPVGTIGGVSIEDTLLGLPVLLVFVIVLGARFRGSVPAVFGATLATALVAVGITVPLGTLALRAAGSTVLPVSALTAARVVVGVALVVALIAVLARALRSWLAASALTVVPYVLAVHPLLPDGVADWLLRLTPAAGFAVQQTAGEFPQVLAHYTPAAGYFPLPGWAGLVITVAYVVAALVLMRWVADRRQTTLSSATRGSGPAVPRSGPIRTVHRP